MDQRMVLNEQRSMAEVRREMPNWREVYLWVELRRRLSLGFHRGAASRCASKAF